MSVAKKLAAGGEVQAELAIRFWVSKNSFQHYTLFQFAQCSSYRDACVPEHCCIRMWQPKLNHPYITYLLKRNALGLRPNKRMSYSRFGMRLWRKTPKKTSLPVAARNVPTQGCAKTIIYMFPTICLFWDCGACGGMSGGLKFMMADCCTRRPQQVQATARTFAQLRTSVRRLRAAEMNFILDGCQCNSGIGILAYLRIIMGLGGTSLEVYFGVRW